MEEMVSAQHQEMQKMEEYEEVGVELSTITHQDSQEQEVEEK